MLTSAKGGEVEEKSSRGKKKGSDQIGADTSPKQGEKDRVSAFKEAGEDAQSSVTCRSKTSPGKSNQAQVKGRGSVGEIYLPGIM